MRGFWWPIAEKSLRNFVPPGQEAGNRVADSAVVALARRGAVTVGSVGGLRPDRQLGNLVSETQVETSAGLELRSGRPKQ